MNEHLKFRVLQLCSGHYLSANIPSNWHSLSKQEQNKFLEDNVWEPFEYYPAEFVWGCIESAADATQHFIEDLQEDKSSISIKWSVEDIQGIVSNDYEKSISDQDALVVLEYLEENYDPTHGVTWTVIQTAIEHLLDEEEIYLHS